MTDPAEIARGLTKAQRRALKQGYVDRQRGYWPLYNAMRSKGLIENGGKPERSSMTALRMKERSK